MVSEQRKTTEERRGTGFSERHLTIVPLSLLRNCTETLCYPGYRLLYCTCLYGFFHEARPHKSAQDSRACQNYKVTQEAHIAGYARFLNLKQVGVTYMKYLPSIATPPNIYRHYSASVYNCVKRDKLKQNFWSKHFTRWQGPNTAIHIQSTRFYPLGHHNFKTGS